MREQLSPRIYMEILANIIGSNIDDCVIYFKIPNQSNQKQIGSITRCMTATISYRKFITFHVECNLHFIESI